MRGMNPWLCAVALACGLTCAAEASATRLGVIPAGERFVLQSRVWPSLHQTLMEAAQRNGVANPGTTAEERADWDAAVAAYRERIGDADPVRVVELIQLDEALAGLRDDQRPAALPFDAHLALSRAHGVYVTWLWPQHAKANDLWIAVAAALLEQMGDELVEAHQDAYGAAYPAHAVVDVTPYGGRFGAYTNDLTFPHAIIGSTVPGNQGFASIESIFHEVSHSVVRPHGGPVGREIDAAAEQLGREPNGQLWHAIQFHVTGELVRRALAARGVEYTPMVTGRLWEGPFRGLREAVIEGMAPRLDGRGTLQEAITAIVERTTRPAPAP